MYKIKLPNFEGPFDLLLYFIKKEEVNIYDIPIARIAEEFLGYIRLMQYFDLELASEFIYMAANLMYIKSQMLLPRAVVEGSEDLEDPRKQLIQRLLEYQQIKDGAKTIGEYYENQKYTYYRSLFEADRDEYEEDTYKNTTIFDLMNAFKKAIEKAKVDPPHIVDMNVISVEEKMTAIMDRIKSKKKVSFYEFVKDTDKISIVSTFLALLNLLKDNMIFIRQSKDFGDIVIFAK
jgi:segregation and condensation protein A